METVHESWLNHATAQYLDANDLIEEIISPYKHHSDGENPSKLKEVNIIDTINISLRGPRNCFIADIKSLQRKLNTSDEESNSKYDRPIHIEVQQSQKEISRS